MATGVELATAWVRLVPSIEGINGEVNKALGSVENDFDSAGKKSGTKFSKALGAAAIAGVAVIAAGIGKVFSTGLEELQFGEKLNAQTDILVKNTGFQMATDQINDYTLSLSKVSGISEEDLQAAGNSILKFGDVSETNYKRAVDSLNDMGSAGKDVAGTSEALGKALADPAKAASLLKRQGVILTDQQKSMIETMTTAGDKAGAQGVILDALQDTYGGMAEKTGGTLQGNMDKLNNQFENLSGDLVQSLMPAIMGTVTVLGNIATWIGDNQTVFYILLGIMGFLALAFLGVTIATWAMNTALLANPITWIVLGIVALIAALVLLILNWDTVVAWISAVWTAFVGWLTEGLNAFAAWWNGIWAAVGAWIASVWQGFITGISDLWNGFVGWLTAGIDAFFGWWNGIWTAVGAAIGLIWRIFLAVIQVLFGDQIAWLMNKIDIFFGWWNGIWAAVGKAIGAAWTAFIKVISDIWKGFSSWLTGVLDAFFGWWNGIWDKVGAYIGAVWGAMVGVVSGAWGAVRSWIQGALDGFFGWWNGIWGTVGDAVRTAFEGISGFVSGIWDTIVAKIKGAVNGIIDSINGMIDGLNGFLGAVGKIAGVDLKVGKIPGLATGGTVTSSGTVLVGERGPELLNLPKGASVNPNIPDVGVGGRTYNVIAAPGRTAAQELADLVNRSGGGGL